MLGQLDWDGVVLPISEVTWQNVLATSQRLQGLEVNEEFFVTYKDEEGDVINVKNEIDLTEAVRWAEEQGVPCLCLHVPFSSAESDSDESWTEIDNGSRRDSSPRDEEVDDTEKRSYLHDDTVEETASVPRGEEEEEVSPPVQPPVEEVTPPMTPPIEEVTPPIEDVTPPIEEVTQVETPAEAPMEVPAEAPLAEEYDSSVTSEAVDDVPPEQALVEAEEEEADEVYEAAEESAPEPVSTTPKFGIDKIIEIMCSVNDAYAAEPQDKPFFVELLAQPGAVDKVVALLAHPAVKAAIAAVAQAELSSPGAAQKASTTQLIKVIYQSSEVLALLNAVPQLEQVLLRVLRGMKASKAAVADQEEEEATETVEQATLEPEEEEEEEPKVHHPFVACDGCSDHDDLRAEAARKGLLNERGEIVGARYKSAVLPDFDLCASCEACGRFQAEAGPFLKIAEPSMAPECLVCVLPGASLSELGKMDWSSDLAAEFFAFVNSKQQQKEQKPAPVESSKKPCKHPLKTFAAHHDRFTCDSCETRQAVGAELRGCRECDYDVCHKCFSEKDLGLASSSSSSPPPPPRVIQCMALPPTVIDSATQPSMPMHQLRYVAEPPRTVSIPLVSAPPQARFSPPPPPPAQPQAKFVSDVTLSDGCSVQAGERLTKTWRIRNSGAERWPAGTRIGHVGGDAFGGPANGVEVPLAAPGEAVNVTVPLAMPTQPGRYTSYWRLMTPHPQNSKFGHRFWVTVNVLPVTSSLAPVPMPVYQPSFSTPSFMPPPRVSVPSAPVTQDPAPASMFDMLPGSPAVFTRPAPPPPPPVVPQAPAAAMTSEFEDTVARIADFGFTDIEKVVRILGEVNGNAAAAIERLLEEEN